MSKSVHRAARGAKDPVCPSLEGPTEAQAAWLVEARYALDLVDRLERDSRRIRSARLESPEAETIRLLSMQLGNALRLLAIAREEGRELLFRFDANHRPYLEIKQRYASVTPLAPYLAAKGGARG